MSSIKRLTELSVLATAALPPDDAVERALPLLSEGLGAQEAFLVYGADSTFRCFGRAADLDLTDTGLWLINRDLTSRGAPCAFEVEGERVVALRSARSRRPCSHVAALVPVSGSAGEMVVARGSWPAGLGPARTKFLTASVPALTLLLERRLDSSRAERQRHQLSALANITRVMAESEDLEAVLTSIAGTISTVAGIEYVTIDVTGADGKVELRALSTMRQGIEPFRERWKRGASRPDPVREAVLQTRQPMLFVDAQNDERIPERGRNFFVHALISSAAVFPLVAKDDVLGVISVASYRPLSFGASEVGLLEGLAAQVASAVQGIRLYQEVAASREQLRRLYQQLQESTGIEHHLARTDPLTGIPNRRFLDEAVDAEVARSRRYGQDLSLIMADLDHLKEVNDAYGHHAGDEVLRFVAALARENCRQVDVVGRYGGDEFLFVLPATGLRDAAVFAERFRRRLTESPIPLDDGECIHVTVSLGAAQWSRKPADELASLIRQADRAMYESKAAGRNRTMLASGEHVRAA